MTLDHLIDCVQSNASRLSIKLYFRNNNITLNTINISNGEFPHNKIFRSLEATNFIGNRSGQ